MCPAPFCVQQVKGQGHTYRLQSSSHRLFEVFVVSILSLRAYMTGSLHMSYKNNPGGGNVPRTISRWKGLRSRSHGLFVVLSCPLRGSVAKRPIHSTSCISRSKGQGKGHIGRSFLNCWPLTPQGCRSYHNPWSAYQKYVAKFLVSVNFKNCLKYTF